MKNSITSLHFYIHFHNRSQISYFYSFGLKPLLLIRKVCEAGGSKFAQIFFFYIISMISFNIIIYIFF